MPLIFLLPLAIALIGVYFFENSADEISYLAAFAAIVGFLVSLVIAPWQIQLLLVVGIFIGSNWLLKQYKRPIQSQKNQPQQDPSQVLVDQGIGYSKTFSTVASTVSETDQKESNAELPNQEDTPQENSSKVLIYRGFKYDYIPPTVEEPTASQPAVKYHSVRLPRN